MDEAGVRREGWEDIADWYHELVAGGSPTHQTALGVLLDLIPDVAGTRVLDLACGQGLAARAIAGRGASVTGVDLTQRLLEHAAGATPPELAERITWLHDDAQVLASLEDAAFDEVACNLALMDIPDLAAVVGQMSRVLRPDGWLVFTLTHPCFLAPHASWTSKDPATASRVIHNYLAERHWRSNNPEGVRRVGAYHRTSSTYLNLLLGQGFVLEQIREPAADDQLAAAVPPYRRIPAFMVIRARWP